jgi:hypothetical protein
MLFKQAIDIVTRRLSFSAIGHGLKQHYLSILLECGEYEIATAPLQESNAR